MRYVLNCFKKKIVFSLVIPAASTSKKSLSIAKQYSQYSQKNLWHLTSVGIYFHEIILIPK
jgi:hypothetical protein